MLALPPCQPSSILLATVSCIVFFHPAPALQHDLCCLPSLCRSGDGEAEWDAVHELVFNHANPSSDRLLRDLAGQAGQHMKGKIKWKQVEYKKCSCMVSSQNSKLASTKQTG